MPEAGDDCTKRLSLFRQPSACRNSPPTFSQISAFCTRPALAAKIEVADLGPSKPPGKGLSAAAMKAASPFVCLLLQICRREKAAMWEENPTFLRFIGVSASKRAWARTRRNANDSQGFSQRMCAGALRGGAALSRCRLGCGGCGCRHRL